MFFSGFRAFALVIYSDFLTILFFLLVFCFLCICCPLLICVCMLCCFCNWSFGCCLGTLMKKIKLNWIMIIQWTSPPFMEYENPRFRMCVSIVSFRSRTRGQKFIFKFRRYHTTQIRQTWRMRICGEFYVRVALSQIYAWRLGVSTKILLKPEGLPASAGTFYSDNTDHFSLRPFLVAAGSAAQSLPRLRFAVSRGSRVFFLIQWISFSNMVLLTVYTEGVGTCPI
jgi:hypothetical protein